MAHRRSASAGSRPATRAATRTSATPSTVPCNRIAVTITPRARPRAGRSTPSSAPTRPEPVTLFTLRLLPCGKGKSAPRSGTEVACCDSDQAFLFRTGPHSPGREGWYVIPRRAHRHEKSPHMIKLDADNGPGQANSLRGRRCPPGGARRRTPVPACQGTHSHGPSFTGKLDSFRTRRKAVTGTGDRSWQRSSTARRLSTGRMAGPRTCPEAKRPGLGAGPGHPEPRRKGREVSALSRTIMPCDS
jgi:hypothetical protein